MKLLNAPVAYYVTPKGLKALQALPDHEAITDTTIKTSYKDKSVGQTFINHTLDVYQYTNLLKHHHKGLKVFTRRDIARYDYFPDQLPDAFLSLPTNDPQQPRRFFFDIVPTLTPRYVTDRRIAQYCEFFDEGGWDSTESEFPIILLVSESGAAEKRLQRSVRAQLNRSDMEEELAVYTSTMAAVANMTSDAPIWTSVEDTDELTTLDSIVTP